jgi:hypothetical protein
MDSTTSGVMLGLRTGAGIRDVLPSEAHFLIGVVNISPSLNAGQSQMSYETDATLITADRGG